jgi:hypothetical protein
MQKKEKKLLTFYRQLPPEDQAAVLSNVRTACVAENSVRKILAPFTRADGDSGKGAWGEMIKAIVP